MGTSVAHFPLVPRHSPPTLKQVLHILPLDFSCLSFGVIWKNLLQEVSSCSCSRMGHGNRRSRFHHLPDDFNQLSMLYTWSICTVSPPSVSLESTTWADFDFTLPLIFSSTGSRTAMVVFNLLRVTLRASWPEATRASSPCCTRSLDSSR